MVFGERPHRGSILPVRSDAFKHRPSQVSLRTVRLADQIEGTGTKVEGNSPGMRRGERIAGRIEAKTLRRFAKWKMDEVASGLRKSRELTGPEETSFDIGMPIFCGI